MYNSICVQISIIAIRFFWHKKKRAFSARSPRLFYFHSYGIILRYQRILAGFRPFSPHSCQQLNSGAQIAYIFNQ
jgi:hypothetical protein